ncbi:MAG: YicC/YloC family endoribonuclease [Bacteroidales bacterium]
MILSMTGYGKSSSFFNGKKISVEIKSLNSKQLDLSIKLPVIYREKEFEFRKIVGLEVVRGKVEILVSLETDINKKEVNLNKEVIKKYYNSLVDVEKDLNISDKTDYLAVIMKLPDVIMAKEEEVSEEEWNCVFNCLNDALIEFNKFRKQEGEALFNDFSARINNIIENLNKIREFEDERIENIRSKINLELNSLKDIDIDKNRFEQEIIYYLEKLDITEEKVRLKNHCDYFLEVLNESENQGKQLNFISQEIGREINTIGSKANDYGVQHLVVLMKDELEKIKEQIANVL